MHGNQVVVYTQETGDSTRSAPWTRHVLDDSLNRGHALWMADVDRDQTDELIVGHSDPSSGPVTGPGLYIYDLVDRQSFRWEKHVIDDGGIAVEDAIAGDVNGDGWIDIVAGGRSTHNVKLYLNRGTAVH